MAADDRQIDESQSSASTAPYRTAPGPTCIFLPCGELEVKRIPRPEPYVPGRGGNEHRQRIALLQDRPIFLLPDRYSPWLRAGSYEDLQSFACARLQLPRVSLLVPIP